MSAQAQITPNGVIAVTEIGTGNYQLLGRFTTPHISNGGFGNWGLLSMYASNGGANNITAGLCQNAPGSTHGPVLFRVWAERIGNDAAADDAVARRTVEPARTGAKLRLFRAG